MVIHADPKALELYLKVSIIVILVFYIQLYCWYASLKVRFSFFYIIYNTAFCYLVMIYNFLFY